jgi:hypothetical protein
MGNMISKKSDKTDDATKPAAVPNDVLVARCITFMSMLMAPAFALAAGDTNGAGSIFCYIAQNLKGIIGTCMLVAVSLWAIEHIFKVSKIHDIVIGVGVVAIVVSGFTLYISKSEFSSSCAFG